MGHPAIRESSGIFDRQDPTLELSDETHVVEALRSLEDFSRLTVRPTSFALELLASKADYLALGGTDRWVGGVRLQGYSVSWRFDPVVGRLMSVGGSRALGD